jgi:mono/diheme cytochrome c family protein
MHRILVIFVSLLAVGLGGLTWRLLAATADPEPAGAAKAASVESLQKRFVADVQPFVKSYCVRCHGDKNPEASLDLSRFTSLQTVLGDVANWELVFERVHAREMPPEEATKQPTKTERAAVVAWIRDLRDSEATRHAGDPGIVLAHRLSNAELDHTIRDLTGVDIRPAREFPVDPANEAGFDNSGESLSMSPALFKKHLAAARLVADHVVLKPHGFAFAPYPVVAETDRDKYCVGRILDFYKQRPVDLADYFLAASRRAAADRLGIPAGDLERTAQERRLSPKYFKVVWDALAGDDPQIGPMAVVRKMWRDLPLSGDRERPEAERLRGLVVKLRKLLKADVTKVGGGGISGGSQCFLLWRNNELAKLHRKYAGKVETDTKKLAFHLKDAELKDILAPKDADPAKLRASFEQFCDVFPDEFAVIDRGGSGVRPLTAGFHLMQGYFRDDAPLCDLVLDEAGRREIDELWRELDFIALAPIRQYHDFIFFERAEPPRFMAEAEFDFARSEDRDCVAESKMTKLAELYLAKAKKNGAKADAITAIETYFVDMSKQIRRVEKDRLAAEPSQIEALLKFAEKAYRRPLSTADREGILGFYERLRKKDQLDHEEALRDTIVTVLLSPQFSYRANVVTFGGSPETIRPLSDYELASRLSYFLWASMPDAELIAHVSAGDLHQPDVLKAQTRRMLADPKVRGLATEFLANWLDIRRFEEHNAVDRQRFPSFTNELRQAMFEEPVRYFVDIAQKNRPTLDLLHGRDTFVNEPLAKHYGMPVPKTDEWIHVKDADTYGRGGLLPMAVFLTKNAPGLRTSPVKRGYWVVKRVLGERIPPPPATVPELPQDEAKLGELTLAQTLARHRADKACAGCHKRFDSVGLVFENFGPIGERRTLDLGGRPVSTTATYPDGVERDGLAGLREYLRSKRQDDFEDNLCRKLLTYALGRGLLLSDKPLLDSLRARLATENHAFGSLVETIVTSPQFTNRRS